jgi:ABC-type sugar transport system permease subunit
MIEEKTDLGISPSQAKMSRKIRELITAYVFLLPAFIAISLFVFVPLFFSFIMSIFRNPSVVELRFGVEFYTNFSNLWWRNLRDFFTATAGDDIGILNDDGIYLIINLVVLLGFAVIFYKNSKRVLLKRNPKLPKSAILVFSIPLTVILTPITLQLVVTILTFLPVFVKLPIEGYRVVLTSSEIEFFKILFNTVFWTTTCVFLHILLGMLLAILMNRGSSSSQSLFRSIFILPWAIPSFVSALVWRYFIYNRRQGILGQITANETGTNAFIVTIADFIGVIIGIGVVIILFLLVQKLLSERMPKDSISKYILLYLILILVFFIGIEIVQISSGVLNSFNFLEYRILDIPEINSTFWITDKVFLFGIEFRMITFSAILTNVWLGVPFMMVSFLAALQSIPQDLYEAADIDGAGVWNKFRGITLPLLKPTLMTVSLLGVIWTFNLFNIFYILADNQNGLGDRVNYDIFVTFIYEQFNRFNYNAAAGLSFTVFVMLVSFSLVYRRLMRAEAIFEGE